MTLKHSFRRPQAQVHSAGPGAGLFPEIERALPISPLKVRKWCKNLAAKCLEEIAATGRIALYYGCAETVTGLTFGQAGEMNNYIRANSEV